MADWSITAVKVVDEPQPRTVAAVTWAVSDGDTLYGPCECLLDPPGEAFTAFADLTEAQMLEWVWSKVNRAAVEADLTRRAALSEEPLPWM